MPENREVSVSQCPNIKIAGCYGSLEEALAHILRAIECSPVMPGFLACCGRSNRSRRHGMGGSR
ncbi:hypothetical protein ASZ90_010139 [hydrocarbon metagenome]|uniref:Uncharacterized protein n=1 Tax=hydrocarbon metagenome TaxID=938273 RepID=A0A0W8FHK9_9ZZZZ